jgi:hypothetical protein
MTAKRKTTKGKVSKKRAKRTSPARKGTKAGAKREVRKVAKKATRPPARALKPKPKPKREAKAPPRAEPRAAAVAPAPTEVTAFSLERVQVAPLRYEAAAALGRLETVQLYAGSSEEGARVETLVFSPSGKGVQSSGEFVHRGDWNGARLVTDKGHLLDADGSCFCRDCEAAGGYTIDDDE